MLEPTALPPDSLAVGAYQTPKAHEQIRQPAVARISSMCADAGVLLLLGLAGVTQFKICSSTVWHAHIVQLASYDVTVYSPFEFDILPALVAQLEARVDHRSSLAA